MIPHTLQIKNFLSYGSTLQTIDFGPYNLICLSGKNGHGKSALLDAITWAVWGCARKTATSVKADQGLMRLGQTHMKVIFDFSCNGQQYRIRRELAHHYGKLQAVLEFGLLEPRTDQVIPLTDKTIKGTQEIIEKTLRLDYDSFVNSTFLRQANANEFSKKSAKERKEVLANILGLNQYEIIRKNAFNKIKEAQLSLQTTQALLQKAATELSVQEELQTQLVALQEERAAQEKKLAQTQTQQQELTQRITTLQQAHQEYQLLSMQQEKTRVEYTHHLQRLHHARTAWRSLHKLRKQLQLLPGLEEKRSILLQHLSDMQQRLQQQLADQQQLLTLQQQITAHEQICLHEEGMERNKQLLAQEQLHQQIKQIEQQQERLQHELQQYDLAYNNILLELQKIPVTHPHITELATKLERSKNYYQQWITQGNYLKNELKNIAHKQQLSTDPDDPSCPLCQQNLSASRRKLLRATLEKEQQRVTHQLNRLSKLLPKLKENIIVQHTYLTTVQDQIQTRQQHEQKLLQIEHQQTLLMAQYTAQSTQLQQLTTQQAQQSTIIITPSAARESAVYKQRCAQFKELQQKVQHEHRAANYNQQMEQLRALEREINSIKQLQQELQHQPTYAAQLHTECSALKQVIHTQEKLTAKKREQEILLTQLPELTQQLQEVDSSIEDMQQQINTAAQQELKLEIHLQRLEQVKNEQQRLHEQLQQLQILIDDYQIIAQAVGKDGIQALLIEEAIPEIEQEANYLLGKLTNNQAHIFIESLRDLKSGGTKETLDIKISDSAGIRPYELFSGGEGFRIDFALRIAISKLLARRSGTFLQTLIIDEGFGSQDDEGLSHIMDALYKIQDDFAKIIIVSHLPALKDQFPVHFVVEKGPQGSKVQIVEHD